ncbi:MAG: hypothetical protein K6E91_08825 [Butyrivibrio sp.]|nr:hypothetical protein [Butyrivibrio sp.]
MQYDFLAGYDERMKNVGRYAALISASMQKQIWKNYGFNSVDEQINVLFAILLYIMEQSLKDEICTIDDMAVFLDEINSRSFHKKMSFEEVRELTDYIVNVILSNEGREITFECMDFEKSTYKTVPVSYIANKIKYNETGSKRISYYLTNDGYNLVLSTLEVENNLKLTVQEMIFKLHLEKQSYDKAAKDIREIFNRIRMQIQRIMDDMTRIRRNALSFSVADYDDIAQTNLEMIRSTRTQFREYELIVKNRIAEFEEMNINGEKLEADVEKRLEYLRTIQEYLKRSIDEHQKILNLHFDLKTLYNKELEALSQMSYIKRFSLRNEVYDRILDNPDRLERMDEFLKPLFMADPHKIYNPLTSMETQILQKELEENDEERMDFGDPEWLSREKEKKLEKLRKYRECLKYLFNSALENGEVTLLRLHKRVEEYPGEKGILIPSVSVFKEVMVELLKAAHIDIQALKEEKENFFVDSNLDFQVNEMLLDICEEAGTKVSAVDIFKVDDKSVLVFEDINDEGMMKTIKCSNVLIRVVR